MSTYEKMLALVEREARAREADAQISGFCVSMRQEAKVWRDIASALAQKERVTRALEPINFLVSILGHEPDGTVLFSWGFGDRAHFDLTIDHLRGIHEALEAKHD